MSFFAIPTVAGQAALAAALAGTAPLTISQMVVGDGAGAPTTPIQTQTALVNQVAEVSVQSVVRSPTTPNRVTVTAILDENTGGFTIRELGLLDNNGVLLFVANCPDTEKQTIAQGVDDVLTLGLVIIVSSAATINLVVPATTYATQQFVESALALLETTIANPARPPFIAVLSGSTLAPPASPAVGDTYLVPTGATGAWAPYAGQLAQWAPPSPLGAPSQWVFRGVPVGTMIGVADVADYWKLTASGWRSIFATPAEHLAGTSTALTTNPAGVAAMIAAALSSAMQAFGVLWCGVSSGSANVQTLTPATPITAYVAGQAFAFEAGFTNTGPLQINVSGVGLVAVLKDGEFGPVALTGGEVVAGEVVMARIDAAGNAQLASMAQQPVAAEYVYEASSCALAPGSYEIDTTSGPVTVTLESAPTLGDNYTFADPFGTWAQNPVTLNPNGATVAGLSGNFLLDVCAEDGVTLIYKSGNWSLQ